jgi:hypothetical protein
MSDIELIPLTRLTLDPELQPRAAIDRTVLENYVQLLVDGVRFPPVVVFQDAAVFWLADGFHRWHSRKVLDLEDIEAEIVDGSRLDALLYSLSANSRHGLQRGAKDYRRAYNIAVSNGLVEPTDSDAVMTLLRCSGSWAVKLTVKAREAAKAQRDAEIMRLKGQGKTHRQVAEAMGVSQQTITNVQKQHNAETGQPPLLSDHAKAKLRELQSPAAENWAAALRALRLVNEQVSVDALFDARFGGFDHVFGQQLEAAHNWINELWGRFVNERDAQRRRA